MCLIDAVKYMNPTLIHVRKVLCITDKPYQTFHRTIVFMHFSKTCICITNESFFSIGLNKRGLTLNSTSEYSTLMIKGVSLLSDS